MEECEKKMFMDDSGIESGDKLESLFIDELASFGEDQLLTDTAAVSRIATRVTTPHQCYITFRMVFAFSFSPPG